MSDERTVITTEAQLPVSLDTRGARLVGLELRDLDLRGRTIRNVVFGDRRGASSTLRGVDLTGATLRGCVLTGAVLRDVWLRDAVLEHCDLRYADLERVQLAGARLLGCDLYRARLGPGTILDRSLVLQTSLNEVDLAGVSLGREALGDALLQESEDEFAAFHARVTDEPLDRATHHVVHRHAEAARIYRALSGYWDGQGQHRDAAWAYVRARRSEMRHGAPWRVADRVEAGHDHDGARRPLLAAARATPAWAVAVLSDLVAGHGEKPVRVLTTLLALALTFAGIFASTGYVAPPGGPHGPWSSLLASLQVLTTTLPEDHVRTATGAWLVVLETGLGIVLLGLLGFVLGNRMRQH